MMLYPFDLLELVCKLQDVLVLVVILAEEGQLERQIRYSFQVAVLIQISLANLINFLLFGPRRQTQVKQNVVQAWESCQGLVQLYAKCLSFFLWQQPHRKIDPVVYLEVKVQKYLRIVLAVIGDSFVLVAGVAQQMKSQHDIVVFTFDFKSRREIDKVVQVHFETFYLVGHGSEFKEPRFCILFEDVDEAKVAGEAVRRRLEGYLKPLSTQKLRLEVRVLLQYYALDCLETSKNEGKSSQLQTRLNAVYDFQCLRPL